ncbi:MAG: transposase, partial [Gammaproteobacteria bacterium]|nr:transposase [Gammaproteobacteria bacterium]
MPGRGHYIAKRHRNEDLQMTTQNQTRANARDNLSQAAADIAAGQPAAMSADRPGAATAPPAGIASHAAPLYLGIDVAKAELVAATRADGRVLHTRAYANNAAGIRKLLRHAAKDAGRREVRACLESTGAYHWAAAEALFDAHGAVAVAPPAAVRDFMRSTMRRNKTDAADAAAIAEFAERMNPRQWRPRREA